VNDSHMLALNIMNTLGNIHLEELVSDSMCCWERDALMGG
jgi:hypothetical protein